MIYRFLQFHLFYPNPCCLVWSKLKEVLVYTWQQIKRGSCLLTNKESSPFEVGSLGNLHTLAAISHLLKVIQRMHREAIDCYWQLMDHIENVSFWLDKTGFLPKFSCVSTTVWMHGYGSNEMDWEKSRLELHKNTTCCLDQILDQHPTKQ